MLFATWYQTHFLHYEYFKHIFLQHFLNHNFNIILNNNTWNLLLNRPIFPPFRDNGYARCFYYNFLYCQMTTSEIPLHFLPLWESGLVGQFLFLFFLGYSLDCYDWLSNVPSFCNLSWGGYLYTYTCKVFH